MTRRRTNDDAPIPAGGVSARNGARRCRGSTERPSTPAAGDDHRCRSAEEPRLFTEREWHQLACQLGLTPRQVAVARLICADCRISDMARRLGLSRDTVGSHLKALYARLKVQSRVGVVVQLVLVARQIGAGATTRSGRRTTSKQLAANCGNTRTHENR